MAMHPGFCLFICFVSSLQPAHLESSKKKPVKIRWLMLGTQKRQGKVLNFSFSVYFPLTRIPMEEEMQQLFRVLTRPFDHSDPHMCGHCACLECAIPSGAHAFEHLDSSWCCYLGRSWNSQDMEPHRVILHWGWHFRVHGPAVCCVHTS